MVTIQQSQAVSN